MESTRVEHGTCAIRRVFLNDPEDAERDENSSIEIAWNTLGDFERPDPDVDHEEGQLPAANRRTIG